MEGNPVTLYLYGAKLTGGNKRRFDGQVRLALTQRPLPPLSPHDNTPEHVGGVGILALIRPNDGAERGREGGRDLTALESHCRHGRRQNKTAERENASQASQQSI